MRPAAYLLQGDARALPLADGSVQCVVTSPPYWGLRDYGLAPTVWGGEPWHGHEWATVDAGKTHPKTAATLTSGFCPCGAWRGVLGLEPTPELYVAHMVEVFREVRRVLRDDGTCWLNLGDSYNAGRDGGHPGGKHSGFQQVDSRYNNRSGANAPGLKPKDLVGIPWRVAFALQADGWWLRSDIVWAKPNPMPESITDRPTKAHEYVFLLTKAARYYYDALAVSEPITEATARDRVDTGRFTPDRGYPGARDGRLGAASTRNRRTVWTITTEPYPEAHFATFPEKLVEPCILAGTSERGACPTCGAPWGREVEIERTVRDGGGPSPKHASQNEGGVATSGLVNNTLPTSRTLGWSPSCDCPPADPVPCRVLDPFSGSGTTVAVAERLGRVGVGVELKPDYLALARRRTVQAWLL